MKFTISNQKLLGGSQQRPEIAETMEMPEDGFRNLLKSYRAFKEEVDGEDPSQKSDMPGYLENLYSVGEKELSRIKYSEEDLQRFIDSRADQSVDGVFISAAVNSMEEHHITLSGVENFDYLGLYNSKDLKVEGDVGDYFGKQMKSGNVEVKGDSGENTATGIEGGEIRVHGEIEGAWGCGKNNEGSLFTKRDGRWEEVGYTLEVQSELHEAYQEWRESISIETMRDLTDYAHSEYFEDAEELVSDLEYDQSEINDILEQLDSFLVTSKREQEILKRTGLFISAAANRLDSVTIGCTGGASFLGYRNSTDLHIKDEVGNVGQKMQDGKITVDAPVEEVGRNQKGGEIVVNAEVEDMAGNAMSGGKLILNDYAESVGVNMDGGAIIANDDVGSLGEKMRGGRIEWREENRASEIGKEQRGGEIEAKGRAKEVGSRMSGGNLLFEGLASYIGVDMLDGEIEFKGKATEAGLEMKGGEIRHLKGEIDKAGIKMEGGEIHATEIERAGPDMSGGEIWADKIKRAGESMSGGEIHAGKIISTGRGIEGGLIKAQEEIETMGMLMEGGKIVSEGRIGQIGNGMKDGEVRTSEAGVIENMNGGEAVIENDIEEIASVKDAEVRIGGSIEEQLGKIGDDAEVLQKQEDQWVEIDESDEVRRLF